MEYLQSLDLMSVSLALLMVLGAVNAADILTKKYLSRGLESHEKFVLSVVVALAVSFIPADVQGVVLSKVVTALQTAFVASGTYKVAQKLGGS